MTTYTCYLSMFKLKYDYFQINDTPFTKLDTITAHTPKRGQSCNFVGFTLQTL